ncbi:MAG TPA: hypothetical protein VF143_01650 [Candidatus Nanopelagicales bacterium]
MSRPTRAPASRRERRLVPLLAGLLLAALAGCGVQVQQQAEPLPNGAALPSAPAAPTPMPRSRETSIHFVKGRQLEGVPEQITDRSANGVMAALEAGPPVNRQANLRTLLLDPLTGAPLLVVTSVSPSGEVVLQRTEGYLELPAIDQVLLIGQVVLSMDEVGLSRVIITDASGAPVALSLPDGRVREGAVTAADYESLEMPSEPTS